MSKRQIERRVWFVYVTLFLMNLVDVMYTDAILRVNGKEANPFMNTLYLNYGIMGIVAVKGAFLLTLGCFLAHLPTLDFVRKIFYGAGLAYAMLTMWHVYGYFYLT